MKTEFVFLGGHFNVATQARRRRLVIAIFAVLSAAIFVSLCGYSNWLVLLLVVTCAANLLGGRNYTNGLVPSFTSGDERETHRRDHAYFLAYWWWDLALLPALLAVGLKNNAFYASWAPSVRAFVDHLPYGLLIAAGILYYTLPQAILLWTEPDVEEAK
jgi:hypothetical protein